VEAIERKLISYTNVNGDAPFEKWLSQLKDKRVKARLFSRLDRLRLGNFGDCKSVVGGVYELRYHFGSGYRVYFGLDGKELVVLLCGGDKSSQQADIATATEYWKEYKNNGN
jgi:putative addiction module killer protein